MINNEEFTFRLQTILAHYDLSASAFAEQLGIGRSSISHIISGRNKPSLEFVLHILENFKEVTFDWLMHGKGNFPKSTNASPNLFTKESKTGSGTNSENKTVEKKSSEVNSNAPLTAPNQNNPVADHKLQNANSDIERIVIFYSDGRFIEYKN